MTSGGHAGGATGNCELLALTAYQGAPRECGEAYGQANEARLIGFAQQEVKPDADRLGYAARCWRQIERSAPTAAEFMRGVSDGARLPIEFVTLLSLHEEIAHIPHCTAFLAAGAATEGGRTLNGQNWDFPMPYYPWPGLLRLEMKGALRTVTYHFPGLWACAGINEAGLALMWTTTGTLGPLVTPEVGVPTYVLVSETLQRRNVDEALRYLHSVKLAGAFNFMLSDAGGCTAVVEALPDYIAVDQSAETMCRANHYADAQAARLARQAEVDGPPKEKFTTGTRVKRMRELLRAHHGSINPDAAKQILTDRDGDWPWLHQYPEGSEGRELGVMTLDSFFAVSEERVFYTCRGGRTAGAWQEVAL